MHCPRTTTNLMKLNKAQWHRSRDRFPVRAKHAMAKIEGCNMLPLTPTVAQGLGESRSTRNWSRRASDHYSIGSRFLCGSERSEICHRCNDEIVPISAIEIAHDCEVSFSKTYSRRIGNNFAIS
jgi:hypothetical protein